MKNLSKFIDEPITKYQVMKFLEKELGRAWIANIDIQRTPLVTRITLHTLNPGRIIGRRGRYINQLTDKIKEQFGIENPQISVVEVKEPFLEPRIVARKAARFIEMGKKVRAVLHYLLREIMKAGALGAEIIVSGKLAAKGARAKSLRVAAGYIPKAGEPAEWVSKAHVNANTKSGIIGVLVRIVQPGTEFPDKKTAEKVDLPKVIEEARSLERKRTEEKGEKKKEEKKKEERKEEKREERKEKTKKAGTERAKKEEKGKKEERKEKAGEKEKTHKKTGGKKETKKKENKG